MEGWKVEIEMEGSVMSRVELSLLLFRHSIWPGANFHVYLGLKN